MALFMTTLAARMTSAQSVANHAELWTRTQGQSVLELRYWRSCWLLQWKPLRCWLVAVNYSAHWAYFVAKWKWEPFQALFASTGPRPLSGGQHSKNGFNLSIHRQTVGSIHIRMVFHYMVWNSFCDLTPRHSILKLADPPIQPGTTSIDFTDQIMRSHCL